MTGVLQWTPVMGWAELMPLKLVLFTNTAMTRRKLYLKFPFTLLQCYVIVWPRVLLLKSPACLAYLLKADNFSSDIMTFNRDGHNRIKIFHYHNYRFQSIPNSRAVYIIDVKSKNSGILFK